LNSLRKENVDFSILVRVAPERVFDSLATEFFAFYYIVFFYVFLP